LAVGHFEPAIHAPGQPLVVRDNDKGDAELLVQLQHQLIDRGRGFLVEVAGRLIGQDTIRSVNQRPCKGRALTLAVARLKVPLEVHAVIGSTENMLGADAYRPGDVFASLDGKSVEIINTDAEGRLVLADALAYARHLGGDFLIDHATLTGACVVALGPWRAGIFTNDDDLADRYGAAAATEGEAYWRMPLDEDLKESLKSDVADLKHTGDRSGGAVTAALFLAQFVGDSRYMHLDIAGPAFHESVHGVAPKGGTGFGVMTAVRFLETLAAG